MRWVLVTRLLALVPLVVPVGCLKSQPKMAPVSGKLLYRDAPVAFAMVQFDSVNGDDKRMSATGTTGQDGAFKLKSYPHGDGIRPGRYKVSVTPYPGSSTIPELYQDMDTTTLEATIPEQGLDNLVLKLTD